VWKLCGKLLGVKRYRIFGFDYDTRSSSLEPVKAEWVDSAKVSHLENQKIIINDLKNQFGEQNLDLKVENFKELGDSPLSVLAFHNKFLRQIRCSYVIGGYYPALTGACALGERILNHMLIMLRHEYKNTPEYKRVHSKKSFDNWDNLISVLGSWGVLLPEASKLFKKLEGKRHFSIHFNKVVDRDYKQLALEAIHLVQAIVACQFSGFGKQPWYFCVPGEIYIKKEWEEKPLIKYIFIPNALMVGPKHVVESAFPWKIRDEEYEARDITDEEFIELRKTMR